MFCYPVSFSHSALSFFPIYFGSTQSASNKFLSNDFFCIPGAAGSINISNILTGKCLAKIRASNSFPLEKHCSCNVKSGCSSKKQSNTSRIRSTVAEALEDITALFYDEERNEIYTGNRHGLVHVWSN